MNTKKSLLEVYAHSYFNYTDKTDNYEKEVKRLLTDESKTNILHHYEQCLVLMDKISSLMVLLGRRSDNSNFLTYKTISNAILNDEKEVYDMEEFILVVKQIDDENSRKLVMLLNELDEIIKSDEILLHSKPNSNIIGSSDVCTLM